MVAALRMAITRGRVGGLDAYAGEGTDLARQRRNSVRRRVQRDADNADIPFPIRDSHASDNV